MDTLDLWIVSGPSRRLRKAYAQLTLIEQEMEKIRYSNPFPGHAPTACRLISRRLRELSDEQGRVLKRIGNIEKRLILSLTTGR